MEQITGQSTEDVFEVLGQFDPKLHLELDEDARINERST